MGKPLLYEVWEKPATSCVIGVCCMIWLYIQKRGIGYSHVGLSYQTAMEGHYWIITSAFSHISIIHLVFNMSALWSLGVVEQLGYIGLGVEYYLQYTLVLVVLSGLLVLAMYHVLIQKFKIEYFQRVTAVGYSCVVFGWMTILATKQPSSKLELFGILSLPISFAPFESLIFTSIIVPQASFLGHLSGIIIGYAISWGLINGMNNYWAFSMLGWIVLLFIYSLKKSGVYNFTFLEIESVTDLRFLASGNGRTLGMTNFHILVLILYSSIEGFAWKWSFTMNWLRNMQLHSIIECRITDGLHNILIPYLSPNAILLLNVSMCTKQSLCSYTMILFLVY